MTETTLFLQQPECFSFFRKQPFTDFVSDICCVSRIRRAKVLCPEEGPRFYMTIHFSGRVDLTVGFDSEKAAVTARRDLVVQLMDCFGADQVVFSNGFYSDFTVVPAIQSLTEIYDKDGRSGFSAILVDAPVSLHFVCADYWAAYDYHQDICQKMEAHRRSAVKTMLMAVNS